MDRSECAKSWWVTRLKVRLGCAKLARGYIDFVICTIAYTWVQVYVHVPWEPG